MFLKGSFLKGRVQKGAGRRPQPRASILQVEFWSQEMLRRKLLVQLCA